MTAEVAILNRSAVALAADSAVTITAPSRQGRSPIKKIYANANKLFELVKGRSVGVMVYDSAEFLQVPWETIVKIYRSQNSEARFETLEQYAEDFLDFVRSDIYKALPSSSSELYLYESFADLLSYVLRQYQARSSEVASQSVRLTRAVREQVWDEILSDMEGEASQHPQQPWADGLDEDKFFREHKKLVLDLVPSTFGGIALKLALRTRIAKFLCKALVRVTTPPGPGTGLVVAGFGESDLYPSIFHVEVGGIISDRLALYDRSYESISADKPSFILPFAQINEAVTFLIGIDPQVQGAVIEYWNEWAEGLRQSVAEIVQAEAQTIDAPTLAAIEQRYDVYIRDSWNRFTTLMSDEFHQRRFGPMEASAAFLSKGELANLAESLIDLASLRNRVSLDRDESVGGAVDVAVISKGDGFVWIKRKHYFDLNYNPTWVSRQAGGVQAGSQLVAGRGSTP